MSKRPHSHLSDDEIVAEFRKSNNSALVGELYHRYYLMVFGVCMNYLRDRAESEDAAAQVFEKLLVDLPKYQVGNFKAWLYGLTKNWCLQWLRTNKRKNKREANFQYEYGQDAQIEDEPNVVLESGLPLLEQSLQRLKKPQQECVRLFYLQELTYKEIVARTDYSMKEVKSHIQNGRRNMKIYMENAIKTS